MTKSWEEKITDWIQENCFTDWERASLNEMNQAEAKMADELKFIIDSILYSQRYKLKKWAKKLYITKADWKWWQFENKDKKGIRYSEGYRDALNDLINKLEELA